MTEDRPTAAGWQRAVDWTLAGSATTFLAGVLVSSLSWRVTHDAPIMLYQAFLMDRFGRLPYRDIFDMNMPGTYLAYLGIGTMFGYDDPSLRVADVGLVVVLCAAVVGLCWRFSRPGAVLAGALVGLRYLAFGPEMTLQREFLALIPIVLGAWAAVGGLPLRVRTSLAGLAFGVATTIKPHAAIGLAPIVVFLALEARDRSHPRRALLQGLTAGTAGFALPLVVVGIALAAGGLIDDFGHTLGYLTYYGALDGDHRVIVPADRAWHLVAGLVGLSAHDRWWWLAVGCLAWAGFAGALEPRGRRQVGLLAGLLLAYTLYPAASGQFWSYHWLPMLAFIAIALPLLLVPVSDGRPVAWAVVPRVLLAGAVGLQLNLHQGLDNSYFRERLAPKKGRADAIAAFLSAHVAPGETVQGMDWAWVGVAHGMLMAEVELATPYVYTFHFYHHVSTPYIRDLRADFLARFDEAGPAYVVEGRRWGTGPWVTGPDTTDRFPELERRLRGGFVVVEEVDEYTIWERRDRASGGGSP